MTLCALIVGIYILVFYPSGPAFLHTSAPAPVHRDPTTHRRVKRGEPRSKYPEGTWISFKAEEYENPRVGGIKRKEEEETPEFRARRPGFLKDPEGGEGKRKIGGRKRGKRTTRPGG